MRGGTPPPDGDAKGKRGRKQARSGQEQFSLLNSLGTDTEKPGG